MLYEAIRQAENFLSLFIEKCDIFLTTPKHLKPVYISPATNSLALSLSLSLSGYYLRIVMITG
jgi:hypothetical protein